MAAKPRKPPSLSTARTMAVGIAVVAVIVGAVAFAFRASNGLPFGQFTYVTVAFTDVGGLLEGDDLRINSVRVGRVEDIQLGENKALVHLRIDGREALYRDASAAMQSQSALGKKFVNLDPGNPQSGPLGEGIIDTTRTKVSNELDTLLDIFDPTTRAALASTVRETGIGAGGHGQDLQNLLRAAPTMLPDLAATAESLASRQAALPELLVAARRLSGRFTGREDNIRQLITQFDNTVRAISVDNGTPLTDTLKTLPDTLDRADQAFHSLHSPLANTEFALADLHDGARALGSATPDVRGVLTESNEPLGRVPHVSDLAVPAVDDLNDTVADLRPLAPRVASVLDHASTPLEVLKPYAPEMSEWFSDVGSALSQGAGDKHWLRLGVLAASDDVSGTVPGVKDPLLERDPYPAPGTARKIRKDTVLGGVR